MGSAQGVGGGDAGEMWMCQSFERCNSEGMEPQGQRWSKIMKVTTANGGTFTWAQLDSVANHVTARPIGDWRALTWLATATG